MISWLMKITGLDSIFVWLIIAGLAVASIWGYGLLRYHSGYDQAKIEYTLRIETMKKDYADKLNSALERQSKANELAKKNESQLIIDYETQIALRDRQIAENDNEAKNDTSKPFACITDDGRMRLNKIK